jgi:PAS domain S-box-containing protein
MNDNYPTSWQPPPLQAEVGRDQDTDLYEYAPVAYFVLAQDGTIDRVNRVGAKLLGVPQHNLIKQHITCYVAMQSQAVFKAFLERVFTSNQTETCEIALVQAGSDLRWIHMTASAEASAGQRKQGRVIIIDMTERVQAEQSLRVSEQFLQATLDSLSAHIAILDETGSILTVNRAWRHFGQENQLQRDQDGIGLNYLGVCERAVGPGSNEAHTAARAIRQLLAHEIAEAHIEYPCHSPTEQRWFMAHLSVFREQEKRRIVVAHENITTRKQIEDALQESQARVTNIINSALDAIISIDQAQRIVLLNPSAEVMFGYDQAAVIGQPIELLLPGRFRAGHAAHVSSFSETGVTNRIMGHSGKLFGRRNSGEEFPIEASISQVRGSGQELYTIILRDITNRVQAETALMANEARFRGIIDASPVPIGLHDEQKHTTLLNSAFVQTFGYTQAEIPTRDLWWAKAFPDSNYRQSVANAWQSEIERMQQSGTAFSPMEVTLRCNNGTNKIVLASAARIANTNAVDHLMVLYDITAQKQADDEKAKLEAQLYQAQKMESVGRLAGGVAHDFNNMLGVILGHTELALDALDPALAVYADIEEIRKAAQRSANLTRQLLAFARQQVITPKILDLNETVMGTLTMLQRMIGENISLVWAPSPYLWSIKIDPTQIDQILTNLCVNARDAISDVGQITIETGNQTFDAAYCATHTDYIPGNYVVLSVHDNGCGMNQDIQEHVFEPFFTTKPIGQGTGLGLATVYGIIKQNNGFIQMISHLGQGTTFRIYLPRHSTSGTTAHDTHTTRPTPGGGETILLVEDEPAILKLSSIMLTRLGYHVISAGTPAAAIQIAKAYVGEIHLLMTDVIMPEMNGRDLAMYLMAHHPRLKRMFMSGYTAEIIARHGVLEEGVFFIQKPFSMKELAAKVREAVDYGKIHESPFG